MSAEISIFEEKLENTFDSFYTELIKRYPGLCADQHGKCVKDSGWALIYVTGVMIKTCSDQVNVINGGYKKVSLIMDVNRFRYNVTHDERLKTNRAEILKWTEFNCEPRRTYIVIVINYTRKCEEYETSETRCSLYGFLQN